MSKELEELRGITRNKIEYIKRQPEIDWVYLNYYEGVLNLVNRIETIDAAIKRLKENANKNELPYIIADIIKNNCSQEVINLILQHLEEDNNVTPTKALECLDEMYKLCTPQRTYYKLDKCNNTIKQALINFNNITKQINEASSESAIGSLNKIKDKLDDYTYNSILESLLKTQVLEKENAKYKSLEKQFGGSLDMILNLMKNSNTLDEHYHTQDIYFIYKGKLISGSFIKLEYDNEFIINVETSEMFDSSYDIDDYDLKVKDYKKTWWLKEDRSE